MMYGWKLMLWLAKQSTSTCGNLFIEVEIVCQGVWRSVKL